VPSRGKSKKDKLNELLERVQPSSITEELWRELAGLLAPISESYLRQLLQATNLPIAQPFGGVRQSTLEELETSLLEIEREYSKALASRNPNRAAACRRAVIQAKDRARLTSRNEKVDPEKRKLKAEMVEWMLIWLENPSIFETWVNLRKPAITYPKSPD